MSELSLQAGNRLGLPVVLLQRQADGVFVLDPPALALVGVVPIEPGKAHFAEAQFARPQPDDICQILAGFRRSGGFYIARNGGGVHEGLVHPVVFLAVLPDIVGIDGPDPLAVGGLLDVLRFYRVHPGVEGDVHVVLSNARRSYQGLSHFNLVIGVSVQPSRPLHDMVYLFCWHSDLPLWMVFCGFYSQSYDKSRLFSQDFIFMHWGMSRVRADMLAKSTRTALRRRSFAGNSSARPQRLPEQKQRAAHGYYAEIGDGAVNDGRRRRFRLA